jgi:response regulator RpfG family c-di-GMP phosphodiesterase
MMQTAQQEISDSYNALKLFSVIEEIYQIQELDALLERVLLEARNFLHADAGTLYLKSKGRLFFSFIQNDTLFTSDKAETRYVYSSRSLPLDRSSLAGYVAVTGESLLIDDVYDIRSDVDYSFNPDFDQKTSYSTRSMLIVPLQTRRKNVIGVLQLINAKDQHGNIVSFSHNDIHYVNQFAQHAASAIEKARLNKEMILRMVELTELRDPYETSQHAKRVGAYSVELFEKWAVKHHTDENKIRRVREYLKTAAMLHDIGKIAVSDVILKKPSMLTEEEREMMKMHTIYGSRMFRHTGSLWDLFSSQITLNHHERWDGKGYPGKVRDIHAESVGFGEGKKGKEIPWSARIVTIADVFDSLISKRSYKNPWEKEKVLDYLRSHAGTQFDPELVHIFLRIQNIIDSIRRKYSY